MELLETDQILEVHSTNKGAKNDLAAWAKTLGHEVVNQTEEDGVLKFWIKKG